MRASRFRPEGFFKELRPHRVPRVALFYAAAGWKVVEVAPPGDETPPLQDPTARVPRWPAWRTEMVDDRLRIDPDVRPLVDFAPLKATLCPQG